MQWPLRHPLQTRGSAGTHPTSCCAHVFAVCKPAQRAGVRPWRLRLHDYDARHVLRQLLSMGNVVELRGYPRLLQFSTACVYADDASAVGSSSSAAHALPACLRCCSSFYPDGATSNSIDPRTANSQHVARVTRLARAACVACSF